MAILNEPPPSAAATPTNHQRGERNMKKNWIISAGVALALGALATVAVAERGDKQPALRMLNRLDLTAEQQEQLHIETVWFCDLALSYVGKKCKFCIVYFLCIYFLAGSITCMRLS